MILGKKEQYRIERQKAETNKILTVMMQELTMYKQYNAYMNQYRKNLLKLVEQYNNMNIEDFTGLEEIQIQQKRHK